MQLPCIVVLRHCICQCLALHCSTIQLIYSLLPRLSKQDEISFRSSKEGASICLSFLFSLFFFTFLFRFSFYLFFLDISLFTFLLFNLYSLFLLLSSLFLFRLPHFRLSSFFYLLYLLISISSTFSFNLSYLHRQTTCNTIPADYPIIHSFI